MKSSICFLVSLFQISVAFHKETNVGMWGYHLRPQVSRKMPRVGLKWVGRCFLSIVMPGYAYPSSRLNVHHLLKDSRRKLPMKRNSFLPNKSKKRINTTSTTKTKTNKYTRILRCTLLTLTLLKLKKYKKPLKYKVSKNKYTTHKDKNKQVHLCIKVHSNNINKIGKYKNLNMK